MTNLQLLAGLDAVPAYPIVRRVGPADVKDALAKGIYDFFPALDLLTEPLLLVPPKRFAGRDHRRGIRLRQYRAHAAHISAPFQRQSARLPGEVSINPAHLTPVTRRPTFHFFTATRLSHKKYEQCGGKIKCGYCSFPRPITAFVSAPI
jgi:hypothetical protein